VGGEEGDEDSDRSSLIPEGQDSSGEGDSGDAGDAEGRQGRRTPTSRRSGAVEAGGKVKTTGANKFCWNYDMVSFRYAARTIDIGKVKALGQCVYQDTKLKEAVALYKAQGWRRVAEHVGDRITGEQCERRWSNHVKHQVEGLVKRDWTGEEVRRYALWITPECPTVVIIPCDVGGAPDGAGPAARGGTPLEHLLQEDD
jgi:hypothetical protein